MALNETILHALADWRPEGGRATLNLTDEASGWATLVTANRNDELGCLVWDLSLCRAAPVEGLTLRSWAERCAAQVSGLLEPLQVVEIDEARKQAMLRSAKPSQRGEKLYYYQLMLGGTTEAHLSRFQASHQGTTRTQIAFPITHEALAKVVVDLTATGKE
jgi:hypothetical protein